MSTTKELVPAERPVSTPSAPSLIAVIAEAARDPHVDAAKMQALWDLKRQIDEHDSKVSFYRSMQAVQDEARPVLRDKEVKNDSGAVTNRYARLEMIDKVLRPIYTKHGFSLTFGARMDTPGSLVITCDCMHRDGYLSHYELPGKLDTPNKVKNEIQALGSTVTYLRRYLTTLIFNVVFTNDPDDNDGAGFGQETLSVEQANKVWGLIRSCELKNKTAKADFLKYMGVNAVENIRQSDFPKAITALNAKLRNLFGDQ